MTPVLVFYYNDGTAVKSFDYTFHNIDAQMSRYGTYGVIQWIKSLCLYHFDDNDMITAKFVKNAGKTFNKYDWTDDANKYRIADDAISLNNRTSLAGTLTTKNVLEQMKLILKGVGTQSASYPLYIDDCLWADIDWISLTWGDDTYEWTTAEECNI